MTVPNKVQDLNLPKATDKVLRQLESRVNDIEQQATQILPDLTKRATLEDALAIDLMGF